MNVQAAPSHLSNVVNSILNLHKSVTPRKDFSSFESSLVDECKRCVQLFQEDKIAESFCAWCALEKSVEYFQEEGVDLEGVQMVLSGYEESFKAVREKFRTLTEMLEFAESGWELVKEGNGISTYWRMVDGEETVSVKLVGTIKAPIANVIAVINENDLWRDWFSERLVETSTVSTLSRFSKTVYVKSTSIGPVSSRDCFLAGHGYDLLQQQAVVIMARDATAQELGVQEIAAPPLDIVRLNVVRAGVLLVPVDENTVETVMLANADPHIPYIPTFLMNFLVKQVAFVCFEQFQQRCLNLPDVYKERIKENALVYGEVEKRLKEFFTQSKK